jgi:hypothetical protein
MRKYVQTLKGPLFVAGKSKECANAQCPKAGAHYYASGVLQVSLPDSTYGLDVLSFIGWEHEKAHRRLSEIHQALNARGVIVNEPTVGKLYRQFLALLGGLNEQKQERLAQSALKHGGVIFAVDALQPEGHGSLLYVLYEVLSETAVGAMQAEHASAAELEEWLSSYQRLPYRVLATLSDGEKALVAALKAVWPQTPHQLCQAHFLCNVAKPAVQIDTGLREQMRTSLGSLPKVSEALPLPSVVESGPAQEPCAGSPLF